MILVKFKDWNCVAVAGKYGNGNKAIELIDEADGERVAVATVNMIEEKIDDDEVFVKAYSENEGMVESLVNAEIIHPDIVHTVPAGWIDVSSYRLTDKVLKELFVE